MNRTDRLYALVEELRAEALALSVALRSVATSPFRADARSAAQKVLARLPAEVRHPGWFGTTPASGRLTDAAGWRRSSRTTARGRRTSHAPRRRRRPGDQPDGVHVGRLARHGGERERHPRRRQQRHRRQYPRPARPDRRQLDGPALSRATLAARTAEFLAGIGAHATDEVVIDAARQRAAACHATTVDGAEVGGLAVVAFGPRGTSRAWTARGTLPPLASSA